MHRDIDLSLLRAFVAVAETGSVTGAARLLNRTQAAVSQQLKRLEDHFNAQLFDRDHKRIALAADGERLLTQARKLLSLNDETWGMMTTPSFEGEVRMGIPIDLVAYYAPSVLRRFNAAWPHVRVSLETGNSRDLVSKLHKNEIDLTFATELDAPKGSEVLGRDRLVWAAAADSSAARHRPLPIAIGGSNCCFREPALTALANAGIDWRIVIEVTIHEAMNAPVTAGLAVTTLLSDTVPDHFQVVGTEQGLPELPVFNINMHLPEKGSNELAAALAHHIRHDFATRYGAIETQRGPKAA